jgi:hypothetical protein
MVVLLFFQAPPSGTDPLALLYFALAGLVTILIETLRRWIKHRMDLWEAKHPLPERRKDDSKTD